MTLGSLAHMGLDLKPDEDLLDAWTASERKLGGHNAKALLGVAKRLRSKLVEKVKSKIEQEEQDDGKDNPNASAMHTEQEILFRQWMTRTREEASEKAQALGASMEDLALGSWYLKYVQQKRAYGAGDTDPDQFPWTLLGPELCKYKAKATKCQQPQMERHRRLLLSVRRAAEAIQADSSETDAELARARAHLEEDLNAMSCLGCRSVASQRYCVWPEKSLPLRIQGPLLTEDFTSTKRGKKEKMPLSELLYAKATVEATFNSGPQAGESVSGLVDKLLGPDGLTLLDDLKLSAVVYHGKIFVVEGNKRLWALREAERRMRAKLEVKVDIQDLYVGSIRGRPALRAFWEKFTTRDGGKTVQVLPATGASPTIPPCGTSPPAEDPRDADFAAEVKRILASGMQAISTSTHLNVLGIQQSSEGC